MTAYKLLVKRTTFTSFSTIGELFTLPVDGPPVHQCYTLEPRKIAGGLAVKPYCIPTGTYDLTIRLSPKFGFFMPHVENVRGFEGILIHWGNYPHDTEGCLLVGRTLSPGKPDFVGESIAAYDALWPVLQHCSGKIIYTEEQK